MAERLSSSRRRAIIVLVATCIGVAATARLGLWQLDRAAQKSALQQALDTRSLLPPIEVQGLADTEAAASEQHYRRVVVQGHWVPGATVFLDNRQMDARAGFFVITPLRLSGSTGVVLVQRGWAPRDLRDRTKVPALPDEAGEVRVVGHIAPAPGRAFYCAGLSSTSNGANVHMAVDVREG